MTFSTLYFVSRLLTEFVVFTCLTCTIWILCNYIIKWVNLKNLPPGPLGLPIVGYLPYMKKNPLEALEKVKQTHGGIFSLYLGSQLAIVLASGSMVREALVKQADVFVGRPIQYSRGLINKNNGLLLGEGEQWKEQRLFSLSTLRDFGVGKICMEARIKEEIQHFLSTLRNGERIADIGDLIRMSISNVICSLEFGKRFDYDDPDFHRLITLLTEHVKRASMVGIRQFFPWIDYIPGLPSLLNLEPSRDTTQELNVCLTKIIKEHEAVHEIGNETDFIHAWITENKTNPSRNEFFSNEQLCYVLRSLFVAGSDTTANTLRWALYLLADQPEIQKRIQREIDDIIGREREPSIQDRDLMPFTEATILEIMRCRTTVPLSLTHTNVSETTLKGYRIPARTQIIPNLWSVHHDPEVFPSPDVFKPERFLTEDGKIRKSDVFMPFSLGKRMCLGEPLAKMEAFLYFTSMLQNFTFLPPEGETINVEPTFGAVLLPLPQRLQIIPR